MIKGLHGMFYSSDADATRAFLRDQLRLPHVDVGDGWLIFDLPEADVGVHPIDDEGRPPAGTHDVSFYCDDIEGTVRELRARGVAFTGEIEDQGYGYVTYFSIPGGISVQLYEPRYAKRSRRRNAIEAKTPSGGSRKRPATKGGRGTRRGTRPGRRQVARRR